MSQSTKDMLKKAGLWFVGLSVAGCIVVLIILLAIGWRPTRSVPQPAGLENAIVLEQEPPAPMETPAAPPASADQPAPTDIPVPQPTAFDQVKAQEEAIADCLSKGKALKSFDLLTGTYLCVELVGLTPTPSPTPETNIPNVEAARLCATTNVTNVEGVACSNYRLTDMEIENLEMCNNTGVEKFQVGVGEDGEPGRYVVDCTALVKMAEELERIYDALGLGSPLSQTATVVTEASSNSSGEQAVTTLGVSNFETLDITIPDAEIANAAESYEIVKVEQVGNLTLSWTNFAMQDRGDGEGSFYDWTQNTYVWPELIAEDWPTAPNEPNPLVDWFRVVSNQVPDGVEIPDEGERNYCQLIEGEWCTNVVAAGHYMLYTGDGLVPDLWQSKEGQGNAFSYFNVGETDARLDGIFLQGWRGTGRYFNGDTLPFGVVGVHGHAANNMLDMVSEMNPEPLTNAGSNCSNRDGCEDVYHTSVIGSGNAPLVIVTAVSSK